jgi:hypothetical protein
MRSDRDRLSMSGGAGRPTLLLLAAVMLAVLAGCGAAEPTLGPTGPTPRVETTAARVATPNPETAKAQAMVFVRDFYDTVAAGDPRKALAEFTCQGQEAGASIGQAEIEQFQTVFPWATLTLIEIEEVSANVTTSGAIETVYQVGLMDPAGQPVTANLLVVNSGDSLCIDMHRLYF